jgi:hypothetical protein
MSCSSATPRATVLILISGWPYHARWNCFQLCMPFIASYAATCMSLTAVPPVSLIIYMICTTESLCDTSPTNLSGNHPTANPECCPLPTWNLWSVDSSWAQLAFYSVCLYSYYQTKLNSH